MKNTRRIGLIGLIIASQAIILTGCVSSSPGGKFSTIDPAPPTAWERSLFDVITNTKPVVVTTTNVVERTNYVTVTVTNGIDVITQKPVWLTNVSFVTEYQTNVVTRTNMAETYQLAEGKGSAATAAIGGAVAAPFGWGGLVSLALGGLLSGYLTWRNRALAGSLKTGQVVAETLAQNIQTLRKIIESTPQGQQLGALAKQYLIEHQAEAGVIQTVAGIVANVVDDASAKVAAEEIQKLLNQVSGTPGKV